MVVSLYLDVVVFRVHRGGQQSLSLPSQIPILAAPLIRRPGGRATVSLLRPERSLNCQLLFNPSMRGDNYGGSERLLSLDAF
jgi:hypothetical protein